MLLPKAKAVSASKRKLIDDSDEEEEWEPAEGEQTIQDPVTAEMERWKAVLGESLDTFKDHNWLFLNEFQLLWEFKDQFSLRFIVFQQSASHLLHTRPTSSRSSRFPARWPTPT